MKIYSDDEKLNLATEQAITPEVKELLRETKRKMAKSGRKISMAKLACNAIIEKYNHNLKS